MANSIKDAEAMFNQVVDGLIERAKDKENSLQEALAKSGVDLGALGGVKFSGSIVGQENIVAQQLSANHSQQRESPPNSKDFTPGGNYIGGKRGGGWGLE